MNHFTALFVAAFSIALAGCAATPIADTGIGKAYTASTLQHLVLADPRFSEIILEMETAGAIDWGEGRTDLVKEDLTNYRSRAEWALDKFAKEGLYSNETISVWHKWNPFSSTTAATFACADETQLNLWKLDDRSLFAIINTLIHERGHSFCLTHPTQNADDNRCDFPYVSGALAESLALDMAGQGDGALSAPMCPELCRILKSRDLPYQCVADD